jgi:hypothetical protein
MKNIHLLPTEKPSRLIYNNRLKSFCFQKEKDGMYINDGKVSSANFWSIEKAQNNGFQPQNIYITNSEEIKEERLRFIIDNREGMNGFIHQVSVILDSKICPEIILTTDQDLIADDVQAIDDKFLEWFVKNPSCEFVEINKEYLSNTGEWKEVLLPSEWEVDTKFRYKIIIPQEDPFEKSKLALRAYLLANKEKVTNDLQEMREKSSIDRDETVEEAAETWVFETNGHKWSNNDDTTGDNYGSFKAGATWQAERMYSEEETIQLLIKFNQEIQEVENVKDWFEQFKKK